MPRQAQNKKLAKTAERKTCRISGEKLVPLFSLGELYLSDFIERNAVSKQERVELKLSLAPKSGLVQLTHSASPDDMYRTYWYRTDISDTMRKELEEIAASTSEMRKAKPGYLLVLPWHFINEFQEREKILQQGDKFIVPCPKFEIMGK